MCLSWFNLFTYYRREIEMSLKYYLLILLFFPIYRIEAQILTPAGQIGSFNSATSFSINPGGFIYVADSGTNEITKIDTLGNVLKFIGGFGWSESQFDDPTGIYATTLNVYVADKNNHRIQFFDKDLNFLSQFSNQNSADEKTVFRYPAGSAVSNQGDIYILDSDNNRIMKFNSQGTYQLSIGSYDAGEFALHFPKQFTIADSRIFVIDVNRLLIFDQFGNGVKIIQLDFTPRNINSFQGDIFLTDQTRVTILKEDKIERGKFASQTISPQTEVEIVDALQFNEKLYVLTKAAVLVYNFISNN